MNDSTSPAPAGPPPSQQEIISAMFASMVIQQTNMASIFLGLVPNPQTGEMVKDLEHARYFIDQLEMLQVKTKGNLDNMEDGLLKQSLTNLRLAFVEAVSKPDPAPRNEDKLAATPDSSNPAEKAFDPGAAAPGTAAESHKKFTKKY